MENLASGFSEFPPFAQALYMQKRSGSEVPPQIALVNLRGQGTHRDRYGAQVWGALPVAAAQRAAQCEKFMQARPAAWHSSARTGASRQSRGLMFNNQMFQLMLSIVTVRSA